MKIGFTVAITAALSLGGPFAFAGTTKSLTHGRALERLPNSCDTLAYVDVRGITSSKLAKDDASLVKDRIRESADQLPGSADWKLTLQRLQNEGFSVGDVDELAACGNGNQAVMALSGDFGGRALVPSLLKAGERKGDDSISVQRVNGRDYARIPIGDHAVYAYEIAPGVLGLSQRTSDLEAAAKRAPTLPADVKGLVYVRTHENGKTITAQLVPEGNSYAFTAVEQKKDGFDPVKDKQRWESNRNAWAKKLEQTPLLPIADDVARAPVNATKDELRIRVTMPAKDLSDAIADAAKSPKRDWRALGSLPTAVGGGPQSK